MCISCLWYVTRQFFSIICSNPIIFKEIPYLQMTYYFLWITTYRSTFTFKTRTSYSSFGLTTFLNKCLRDKLFNSFKIWFKCMSSWIQSIIHPTTIVPIIFHTAHLYNHCHFNQNVILIYAK